MPLYLNCLECFNHFATVHFLPTISKGTVDRISGCDAMHALAVCNALQDVVIVRQVAKVVHRSELVNLVGAIYLCAKFIEVWARWEEIGSPESDIGLHV